MLRRSEIVVAVYARNRRHLFVRDGGLIGCELHWSLGVQASWRPTTRLERLEPLTARVKIAGLFFRSLLLIVLGLMAARVSAPQHLGSTWYDVPRGDLIRALLGIGFCVWMLVELFILPKDPASYRTWMYLGVTLLPLGVVCLIVVW